MATGLSPKNVPHHFREKGILNTAVGKKSIFSCNSIFRTFFTPHEYETKASWRFSPRESMLALTLPDQIHHALQPALKKGGEFKPFSNTAWAPGLLGVELLHVYVICKHSNLVLQPGLDPSRVWELDCCALGQVLVHLYLCPARAQDSCPIETAFLQTVASTILGKKRKT